jgi:hypothetical protein
MTALAKIPTTAKAKIPTTALVVTVPADGIFNSVTAVFFQHVPVINYFVAYKAQYHQDTNDTTVMMLL